MCDILTAVITLCDILPAIPAPVWYINRPPRRCDILPGQFFRCV